MQSPQQDDRQILKDLNVEIGIAEAAGYRAWLSAILAPRLAFLRANGTTFDDQVAFLAKVAPDSPRETEIESIEIFGNRAVVRCIVTVKSEDGDKKYDNLRLFVRHDGQWKLLGWANEPHPEASDPSDQSVSA